MSTSNPLPPAGWYPDSTNPTVERYWDGQAWSSQTRPVPSASAQFGTPQPPAAGQPPAAPTAAETKKKSWFARHKILTGIGALIVIIVLASIINPGGRSGTGSTGTAPTASDASAAPDSTDAPADSSGSESSTISGGDHVVGTDIAAGQYRAEVAGSIIALCTVSQTNGDKILDVRNANEGSVIFTVQDVPGSIVSFSGCEKIALAADVIRANPTEITNGDWLVGSELAPGQYRGTVDSESTIPYGAISQTKGTQVLDIRNANEGSVVFTVKDVAGSVVSFQGLTDIRKA